MVALLVVLTATVLLLSVLVAGLLRSHADILRALHSLGAGVGDPVAEPKRSTTSVHTVAGATPDGGAVAIPLDDSGRLTLLAFLSTGCTACHTFWHAFAAGERPMGTDVIVVTKGPEYESPGEVQRLAHGTPVVMSDDAWTDYEVPGAPFFALVDGRTNRRIGEGVANQPAQLADLVRRALLDRHHAGPQREMDNDQILAAAGIRRGDPSLYPKSLDDVFKH